MELPLEAECLRIYTGEQDKYKGRPLYEYLVDEAGKMGLAGATVLRGISGFGANSRVHSHRILRLSEDLPLVVEIIDTEEKIQAFLPLLNEVMVEGLVTLERVRVFFYRHNQGKKR
ncbi:MAG: DUF190 domain-containing protein [Desulfovibrio sp.]|nr:MAG: DUF190 domain-containing protein [Desulfovibrio sp.]